VNRALPQDVFGATDAAPPPLDGASPALAGRLAEGYDDLRRLAARQRAALAPLVARAGCPTVAEVPLLANDAGSLASLSAIGRHLLPRDETAAPARGTGR
jgi:hypothetical protein